jgi:hypothetical protein
LSAHFNLENVGPIDPRDLVDLYADENKPETKFTGHTWQINLPRKEAGKLSTKTPVIWLEVDTIGIITLHSGWWLGKRVSELSFAERREVFEWLTEWELAVWRAIGPDDSEIFATKKLDPELGIE